MIDLNSPNIDKDQFRFVVPADLEKAADGSYKIRGLASTESMDQQGETIVQKGVDLTPIDKKKGILNWDHKSGPENTIGVLDAYQRTAKGLVIEGRLFKNHTKAKAVKEIMESLSEGDRGRMGLSVEGRILERDPANPSIIRRCQISAVALTMNPVNTDTFADMVKSMNASESLEIDAQEQTQIVESNTVEVPTFTATQVLTMIQKALSIGSSATDAPDSKTGGAALQPSNMTSEEDKKKKKEEIEKGGKGSGVEGHRTAAQVAADTRAGGPDFKRDWGTGVNGKRSVPLRHQVAQAELKAKVEAKRKMKKMDKSLYKSNLISVLDKLQVLYPEHSRSEIWEAVKDRLETNFGFEKGFRIKNTTGKEREHKLYEDARQRDDYEENKDKSRAELNELAEQSGADKHSKEKIRAQADAAKQVGDRDHVRPNIKG